ncbi:MAG: hypothetical protein R3F59_17535 [Myxococcota bacterium]
MLTLLQALAAPAAAYDVCTLPTCSDGPDHCDAADPADCLYESAVAPGTATRYPATGRILLTDPDAVGYPDRPVPVIVNVPDAPGPLPVVILSHGGSGGVKNPGAVMQEWFDQLGQQGFVTVTVAHWPRDNGTDVALCDALGIVTACPGGPIYDRPQDVSTVIDWLQTEVADPASPLYGKADLDRIALLGHSAGAGGAAIVGGATRVIGTRADGTEVRMAHPDPRVEVVVLLSPPGPNSQGVTPDSYQGFDVPALIASSLGDVDENPPIPGDRADAFYLADAEQQYLAWVDAEAMRHSTLNLRLDDCVNFTDVATCTTYVTWLARTTLAFLDGYLRCDADALDWLDSDAVQVTSADVFQLDARLAVCPLDSDGDGVLDEDDLCPDPPDSPLVGPDGCSGRQAVALACGTEADHPNHGQYVSCVTQAAQDAVDAGLLTQQEKADLVAEAASGGHPSCH